MTSEIPSEWRDLTELWQSDGTAVSSAELQERERRVRLQMWAMAAAEILGSIVGFAIALWLAIYTPFVYLGWGLVVCVIVSTVVAMRLHFNNAPSGDSDVLKTLEEAIARDDKRARQLQLGRGVGFAALFAVVMALSTQLRELRSTSSTMLMALQVGAVYVAATLAWNAVLTRRLHQRRANLRILNDRLRADRNSQL